MTDKSSVIKNKKGAVLIYTTMVMMILAVCCVSFTLIAVNMYKNTAKTASKQQSFLFAKSIGQSLAVQLANDYETSNIVSFLENNTDSAATVTGTVSVRYDKTVNEDKENGYDQLTDIDISNATIKFYFITKCKDCGVRLENVKECPRCGSREKNVDKHYLYVDVTVSYNGATELVTSVFTYLDVSDFKQTMVDLFSVYNIYSTFPSEMTFNFANSTDLGNSTNPNVYLYNGTGVLDRDGNVIDKSEYKIETDIKANLTSTGDVVVKGISQQGTIREIKGTVTSYGAIGIENIKLNSLVSRGAVTVGSDSVVSGTIYGRSTVNVSGENTLTSNSGKQSVLRIEALGNITLENCNVGTIIGGSDCKVTLKNSTCGSIETKGSVVLKEGSVCDKIIAGKTVEIYDSTVKGTIATDEDVKLCVSANNKVTTIGLESNGKNVIIKATKDLTYSLTNDGTINVYGSLDIGGGMKNTNASGTFNIYGNITVAKGYAKSNGESESRQSDLACIKTDGDISLENHIPNFKGKCEIGYIYLKNSSGTISEWYTAYELFSKGWYEEFDDESGVSEAKLLDRVNYTSNEKYADLKGSIIKGIIADSTCLAIQNGTIEEYITGKAVALYGITISANASVNSNTVAIIGKNSHIYGKLYAENSIIQREGSSIEAADGKTAAQGLSVGVQTKGYVFLDGEVSGEVVCGSPSSGNGTMYIMENAVLVDNAYDQNIYVYGTLRVLQHLRKSGYNDISGYPRLVKNCGVGNSIYVSGTVYLSGWVCNLYVNGDVVNGNPTSSYCQPKFVKGESTVISDVVLIGKDGYQNSEGAKFINENVIVYIYETPTNPLTNLSVAGTLVIGKGVKLECDSIVCDNIIGDFDAVTATECKSNQLAAQTKLKSEVNKIYSEGDLSSTVSNLTINYHFQSNMVLPNGSTLTFKDCTFKGWFKMSNSKGTIELNNCSVTGKNSLTYSGAEAQNSLSRGCVDVSDGNLVFYNSYIGGTKSGKTSDASGNVSAKNFTINGGIVWGSVYCEKGFLYSNATINGDLTMSGSGSVTWDSGNAKVLGRVYAPKVQLTINSGQLGSSLGADNITAESGRMDIVLGSITLGNNALIGSNNNVYLMNSSATSVLKGTLGNVKSAGDITISGSGSVVNGVLYVEGTLKYSGVSPSAGKGLYAKNISGTLNFSKTIDGDVYLPDYDGSVKFSKITGDLNAPNATIERIYSCLGNVVVSSMTIQNNGSDYQFGGINCSGELVIEGWNKSKNTDSGKVSYTTTINGEVLCGDLLAKTDVPRRNQLGTSYDYQGSADKNLFFKNKIKATGYCYLSYTEIEGTLYTLKGIYAQNCDFTASGSTSFIVNDSDGKIRGNAAYVKDSVILGSVYVCNRTAIFTNTVFGKKYTSSSENLTSNSRTYKFYGDVTLNSSTVYGASFATSGDIKIKTYFLVQGNLTLGSGTKIGAEVTQSYDGLYVGGTLTENGCEINLNKYTSVSDLPEGNVSTAITVDGVRANDNVNIPNYTTLGETYTIVGVQLEVGASIAMKTLFPSKATNTHTFTPYQSKLSTTPTGVSTVELDTSNWNPMAIPLTWQQPTSTFENESVTLNNSSDNVMTLKNHYIAQEVSDNMAAVKDSATKVVETDISIWDLYDDTKELIDNCAQLIRNIGSLLTSLPLLFQPSSKYLGLTFASKEDAKYYRVSASNISNILKDAEGADMMLLTRKTIVAKETFPSEGLLDLLTKYTGYDPKWVVPIKYNYSTRPVGLVFFNSGIVPEAAIDATYRDDNSLGTEKDSQGRWYWGSGSGITEGNVYTGGLSTSNDVCWTFFTCEDPTDPYGSAAKDLHIILPKNTKMVWSKDKDSTVSIIGNGRVFLYLQEGTDIKVVGNGLSNWLHEGWDDSTIGQFFNQFSDEDATYNVFGGVRYVATTGTGYDKQTYYDENGNILLDEKATSYGNYQLQPRMYIVGTGGDISFEVEDFQTAAYVYMPSGYSYGDYNARNTFKVSSKNNIGSTDNWDVYGVYVCDNFVYDNGTNSKVNYIKTVPDLSNTVFKYTAISNVITSNNVTTLNLSHNNGVYQLAEFWDYPMDLPVSSMEWYYRGISLS